MLQTTVASVNSALQRARGAVRERVRARTQQRRCARSATAACTGSWSRYVEAWERNDVDAFTALLVADATFAMPPLSTWYTPRETIATWAREFALSGEWRWRTVLTAPTRSPRSRSTLGTRRRKRTCRSRSTCSACAKAGQRRHRIHRPHDRRTGSRRVPALPRPADGRAAPRGRVRAVRAARPSGVRFALRRPRLPSESGSGSQNTKPSLCTTSPRLQEIGWVKIGPL